MFKNGSGGFFCCEPGELGMNPSSGKEGGLCEPADQPVPKSQLATIASQIGIAVATPAPMATASGSNNATATGASNPTETNPSSASPTTGNTTATTNISKWPTATKIGAGVGVLALFVLLCVVLSICKSRRRRTRNVIPGAYGYDTAIPQYDEFGNRVDGYGPPPGYVQRPGYEPYRPVHSPSPAPPNHVTVNVVQGDLNQ
ncbi:uncharacterized protein K444DRAFT_661298 [Hyaloscypha bicolor E]|uniref:Uncharacterized protein n=1 Tax=Hyaloscypha bicolor E TaxID=1095630 RepID=A0A2J6TJS6_9HELO|nr:uncharacterized protein K444DRAFT_661298 [Hyaloscypha bicolor E]PMD63271.1 hypothetical protein K444DRAFT_661298 [Hyaloscypha bicolor E]